MNRYGITINQHTERIELASKAYTAVRNAMARHIEGEYKPIATIKVRFIGKCERTWYVVADVPYTHIHGTGYSRTVLADGFSKESDADASMQGWSTSHPDYKNIRLGHRIKAINY